METEVTNNHGENESPADQGIYKAGRDANGRFLPGVSGNPAGRPTAGGSILEWIDLLVSQDATEADLITISRDKSAPVAKRAGALRLLRMVEQPDMADFEAVLEDKETLAQARKRGVRTDVIKKVEKTKDGGRRVELYDRSGDDFDRILDRTVKNKDDEILLGPLYKVYRGIDEARI